MGLDTHGPAALATGLRAPLLRTLFRQTEPPKTADLLEEIAAPKMMLAAAKVCNRRKDKRIANLERPVAAIRPAPDCAPCPGPIQRPAVCPKANPYGCHPA